MDTFAKTVKLSITGLTLMYSFILEAVVYGDIETSSNIIPTNYSFTNWYAESLTNYFNETYVTNYYVTNLYALPPVIQTNWITVTNSVWSFALNTTILENLLKFAKRNALKTWRVTLWCFLFGGVCVWWYREQRKTSKLERSTKILASLLTKT